ncbi:2-keto-4-pentenoate hydratase/2-oxohepta-3-ene-1,7-dioic acid hydratase in catechol pathway [Bacillus pakistanensis]|uniref:2-keto-4-pentenoate hydratase/2-oxohepta-3-ene-1,7-dioic acid hydratase in catechol pathway n=1 Tax=Rossellomorea pakistanensis TaxID=992288 RepID=A0ABS2NF83_9BACI|nr:fumarylacetoacetate hydrolase family protein [Bacillus pakistanensis]MBM7586480.1 2-keto-4-pentenoate hydratase/2-oxohepta-3-ene-1,7-dioic acid hydratase in catechol pathway [Bacillus pakistanensis]
MKLAAFQMNDKEYYGVVEESEEVVWNVREMGENLPDTLLRGIQEGASFIQRIVESMGHKSSYPKEPPYCFPIKEVKWKAPISVPTKNIMCVGKNYRDHAIEMGSEADIPQDVMVFTKAPTSVIGHMEDVLSHHGVTEELDYEGELALIIGKAGKGIDEKDALDFIFGYTIINDITARDLQKKHKQFFIGKSLDTTCPMGPWIVTSDEIPQPNNLTIMTKINGEIRQHSNTKHFIFPIERIISELSKGMTLQPGDIIATGTPAGVGKGFNPPKFLKSGDMMEISIEGIGVLKNNITP